MQEELLHKVLPPNQHLFGHNYNGKSKKSRLKLDCEEVQRIVPCRQSIIGCILVVIACKSTFFFKIMVINKEWWICRLLVTHTFDRWRRAQTIYHTQFLCNERIFDGLQFKMDKIFLIEINITFVANLSMLLLVSFLSKSINCWSSKSVEKWLRLNFGVIGVKWRKMSISKAAIWSVSKVRRLVKIWAKSVEKGLRLKFLLRKKTCVTHRWRKFD